MRSTNCGDATGFVLTEAAKSRWLRSMLASESSSFPWSDPLWVHGAASRYMLLVKMMNTRNGSEVKSGVQITVVIWMHGRHGVRRYDCRGDQENLQSAEWMVVVVERKRGRGISVGLGGLLVREPVQGELPAISQKSDEGPTEADVHESM